MLTAKDINNKKFEQARPGYNPNEVDDFLREIALQITEYQREKEETTRKIEILVESVREYKKDEEALKDALIGAQKQSRMVISEAQANADKILSDATVKAGDIIGNTKSQLEREKQNLVKMQQEVSDFKANLLAMYKKHLAQITAIPDFDDEEEDDVPEKNTGRNSEQASKPVPEPPVNNDATRVIEPHPANASPFGEPLKQNKNSSKFGDLKFGENR